ncbi:MAG TPA: type II toxin-antitoxin system VapC family toxin [Dissulfurispiraceae bacterium]|nr:type II toxin-antitoxin system VapC family toxin [Dissulfurispiraceae bacterium]
MMYFDSTALIKKYIKQESGRQKVVAALKENHRHLATSSLTHLEIISALARRKSEIVGYQKALDAFQDDWQHFIVWAIDAELIVAAEAVATECGLCAGDAIHLATALSIQKISKDKLLFMSSKQDLLSSAKKKGLLISDPAS